ncbi:MAG: flagellar biosynthetic protein FliO [Planctomycetota bacterium]|jgi:flagellar biosynthetic protein FliO
MPNRLRIEVSVSDQGKRIATLLVALVVGGGSVGLAARAGDPNEVSPPTAETQGSFLSDPNLARQSDLSLGSGELFVKMMLSVVLVVILAVAALYLSKRVLPKVTKASGKEIRVTETSYLGPRRALHLVEIGNQKLLIGSTNESITTLAHIGDAWLDLSKSETENAVSP